MLSKKITIQKLKTLNQICEIERRLLLTVFARSVENNQIAGYLLTGNRSDFLYVEVSTASLYDCLQFDSLLIEVNKLFWISIYYGDTVIYIRPLTRQIFKNALPKSCDNNPQNNIALHSDNDDHYVLTPKLLIRANPAVLEAKQIQSAICWTFWNSMLQMQKRKRTECSKKFNFPKFEVFEWDFLGWNQAGVYGDLKV